MRELRASSWIPQAVVTSDDNRKLCSLFLSIMDRMGVNLDRFGDAETRLESL